MFGNRNLARVRRICVGTRGDETARELVGKGLFLLALGCLVLMIWYLVFGLNE